jgi:anti-sigma factor RsiW
MTLHPRDDLAAFALGALDAEQARGVRAHLAGCEVCLAEVSSLEEAAFAIAATSERDVPARLRRAIVERAHRDRRATPRGTGLAALLDALRRPVPSAVPVALAILLAISLAAYVGARNDSDRYARALSGIAGARVVALAPTGEVAGVRGSLVIPANDAAPYLILDLPAAPSGKTWEAWVLRGETPLAAGITNDRGVTTLVLIAPLASGDGVAVTLEPSGGVDRVTGAPVLAGKT